MPLADKIAAKHNNYIVNNHYPDGNYRMRKDFSYVEALQKDKKQEAEKDKIVMDGINVVLNMPIPEESKNILIKDNYKVSDEFLSSLFVPEVTINNDNLLGSSEAQNENAEAQARLRGSVGGVQGILAIQTQVANGITSESSAIATLIEIYGFDRQTAIQVLGI